MGAGTGRATDCGSHPEDGGVNPAVDSAGERRRRNNQGKSIARIPTALRRFWRESSFRWGMLLSAPRSFARARTSLLFGFAALSISNLVADPGSTDQPRRRERVYEARVAEVPLQPFSLDPPPSRPSTNIKVAYYTPSKVPRAELAIHDEESEVHPDFEMAGGFHPMVPGDRAVLKHGIAYAPSNAPDRVKSAIWAVNSIRTKPYVWGGGHGSFNDSGYDCSGAISFALYHAGALNQPLLSSDLRRFGERGRGRWITIYSRRGHTFAMIAGLRLDTTDLRYGGDVGPRWYNEGRDSWGFEARHPAKL